MFIKREAEDHLLGLAKQFPVIAVLGPRQSGKTTLAKKAFPDYVYVSMENLGIRRQAQEDPQGFFATYADKPGVIIDEIQEAPELFSYMQGIVDESYRPGRFIVTGSQNFLLHEKITQTLAGRIALLTLLPLTIDELKQAQMLPETLEQLLFKGCYPRLYAEPFNIHQWLSQYISTYVEKDVRQVLQINDVLAFQKFITLCAARVGNLLNYANLARDCDISPNTAKAWISILETSYIITLLQPYNKNFNKRIVKSPKLYFYDTGLVCELLGIQNANDLHTHPIRGALFESFIVSQVYKYRFNQGEKPHLYFWRDTQGHEIDCIIEKSFKDIVPVEIKSSMTLSKDFFKELKTWNTISQQTGQTYAVYAGKNNFLGTHEQTYAWVHLQELLKKIYGT